MNIDKLRSINLIAELNATFGPYYSSHDTVKRENSVMKVLSRSIPSPECDFIDINDLLDTSTTIYRLSLSLNRIKEEALETIDLTGIDKTDVTNLRSIGTNERQITKKKMIPKESIGMTPVIFPLEVHFLKGLLLLLIIVSL
jgi:hypothetical protein